MCPCSFGCVTLLLSRPANVIHILLTSAGRRVALLQTLRADAMRLGVTPLMLAADMSPQFSSACASADKALPVSRCTDSGYTDGLLAACEQQRVGLLIPTIDPELAVLAGAKEKFAARGIRIAVSSAEAVAIARDKQRTTDTLAAAGVPTPQTASLSDVLAGKQSVGFPAVLKRVDGSRSIGLYYVNSIEEARQYKLDVEQYVAQECCVGPEYTVNCFVDQRGALRAAVPHRRIEVRDGEVSKGITERRTDLTAIAYKIVAAIPGLRGPFCFQAILTSEGPKVFEINARFGGGYPLAHAAGATFGKWLIEEALGLPCTANDEWQDGLLMLRYDAAVFVKQ